MYKVASFFTGVGGIDLGFESTGHFRTVYANEFDKYPAETFSLNFPIVPEVKDIREIDITQIPDFDILVGGFPCQAFSIAGKMQGFDDEKGRGTLFFELAKIFKERKPEAMFFENVKNLISHDGGNTFKVIREIIEENGYFLTYKVLNAMEYGNIPQNRERVYIVCFRDKEAFNRFEWPDIIKLTCRLEDVIDFTDAGVDEKYYYTPGKYANNLYEKIVAVIDDDRAVYQWRHSYCRKNKKGVVPTLTANQGEGGHNVCIVKTAGGIRKMLPRECFNTQGFPSTFVLPDQKDSRLYKQAGNSVCVPVITRIAERMNSALTAEKNV